MAIVKAKKTFVVMPTNSNQFEIFADNMGLNRDYYEFVDATGIVAFVPANVAVVEKDSLNANP